MANPETPSRDILAALVARQEITRVLHLYCRGCDRADEAALRACFHPGSVHAHGAFRGLSADFVDRAMAVVRPLKACSHMITNVMIELNGEGAVCECHFLAHQRRDKADGSGEEDMFLKGRYLDRFEKRDGAWKIVSRTGLHDFERVLEPADRTLAAAPPEQRGRQWPDDPLYAMLAEIRAPMP
jgi:hypothetical protein